MGDSRKCESLAKGIEVMTAETRGELWVWVFSPAGKQFPNGIFYTRDEAEAAIKAWGLSGSSRKRVDEGSESACFEE